MPTSPAAALLFVLTLFLIPTKDPHSLENRMVVANAIATVTDDPLKQATLVRLAAYESLFASDVGRCMRKGDGGKSHGTYQIQPIDPGDAKQACGTQEEQARLALHYIHRGAASCGKTLADGPDALNRYVSGLCRIDGEAARMAKRRYGGTPLQELETAEEHDRKARAGK